MWLSLCVFIGSDVLVDAWRTAQSRPVARKEGRVEAVGTNTASDSDGQGVFDNGWMEMDGDGWMGGVRYN
jgi:hypothetical protein